MNDTLIGMSSLSQKTLNNDPNSLEDIMEIESFLYKIKQYQDDIEHYKVLKKRRTEVINIQIAEKEDKIALFKKIISNTLKDNKTKNIDFPGVGKINVRKTAGKWIIDNEEQLLDFLKDIKEYDNITKTTTSTQIVKANLNKLLKTLLSSGNVPEAVRKEDDKENIAIQFDENVVEQSLDNDLTNEDFDGLEF